MSGRLTRRVITFRYPFFLDESDDSLPAGAYSVEMEDETKDGQLLAGRHAISTTLVIRSPHRRKRRPNYLAIDREGLEGALERDRNRSTLEHLAKSREFAQLGEVARASLDA